MSENLYNQIHYQTVSRSHTHPDRMSAVGTLFGMSPAPVTNCRALEIGCGDGANLMATAYHFPESHFTGVDLAEYPIAEGRRVVETVGIGNLRLVEADLCSIDGSYGEFDYIIAHGVYSWVPPEVRDGLLRVCRERLAPQGIAYISYNANPGRHIRQVLREMMTYHLQLMPEGGNRLEQAHWLLQFLQESPRFPEKWKEPFGDEIRELLKVQDHTLFHDDLSENNTPVYFHEFAAHAGEHGLQYLGESDPSDMFDLSGFVENAPGGFLEREQYMDFMKLRRFRQTLLCHAECALDRRPVEELVHKFYFSSPAIPCEGGQIEGLRKVRITSVHEATANVTGALATTWPLPLSYEELQPYGGDEGTLRQILAALATSGFANIHTYNFPCQETVSEKPVATRLARYQAVHSPYVSTAIGHLVELDPMGRRLVPLLDGTRTEADLVSALAADPEAPPKEKIEQEIGFSLAWLAAASLLEA